MCALRTTKMKAGYKVVCRAGSTVMVDCTIDGEKESYMVGASVECYKVESQRGDRYSVTIAGRETCECKGFQKGFRCRHIRLVSALQFNGVI